VDLGEHARRLRVEQVDQLAQEGTVASYYASEQFLAIEGLFDRRQARCGQLGEDREELKRVSA
jgi:hypothetical protein